MSIVFLLFVAFGSICSQWQWHQLHSHTKPLDGKLGYEASKCPWYLHSHAMYCVSVQSGAAMASLVVWLCGWKESGEAHSGCCLAVILYLRQALLCRVSVLWTHSGVSFCRWWQPWRARHYQPLVAITQTRVMDEEKQRAEGSWNKVHHQLSNENHCKLAVDQC